MDGDPFLPAPLLSDQGIFEPIQKETAEIEAKEEAKGEPMEKETGEIQTKVEDKEVPILKETREIEAKVEDKEVPILKETREIEVEEKGEPIEEETGEIEAKGEPIEEETGNIEAKEEAKGEPIEQETSDIEAKGDDKGEPMEQETGEIEAKVEDKGEPIEETTGEIESKEEPTEKETGEIEAKEEAMGEPIEDKEPCKPESNSKPAFPKNKKTVPEDDEIFLGFESDEMETVYPQTEYMSDTLHAMVREFQAEHATAMAELFALQKIPIAIPRSSLKGVGGSLIYIEKIITKKDDEVQTFTMTKPPVQLPNIQRSPGSEGELIIDEGIVPPTKTKKKTKKTPVAKTWHEPLPFSEPELQLLRRPLSFGWIRDVVLKPDDGTSAGQVSYFAPDGTMIRSYKDLAVALTKGCKGGLSRANFSFTARPVGGSKNEVVRKLQDLNKPKNLRPDLLAEMPKLRPAQTPAKRKRPDSDSSATNSPASSFGSPALPKLVPVGMTPSPATKRRRGFVTPGRNVPKNTPPRKNTLIEKMQVNDAEGGLFGISALSEIFAGMEKADAERELEEYSRMMSLMAAQENVLEALDPTGGSGSVITEDGELVTRDEVLPCSIRCPGLAEKIPELQCIRCLCLYHTECLGLPEDTEPTNFLCANCEGTDAPSVNVSRSPSLSPSKDAMYDLMHKMLDVKGSPVSTVSSPSPSRLLHGFGKQISIKKIDSPASSHDSSPSNRGRRVPVIPQLTSHNLTITPLVPFGKGQIPRVPNLSPMNKLSSTSIPVFKRGRAGAQSTLVDSIPMNPQRQSHMNKQLAQDNRSKQRYPIPNFGASFGTVKQPTSNIFRNYPQSVVSVGQRKFIVIPKSPPPNVMEMFGQQSESQQSRSGGQRKFLAEIFKYLTVRDLLKASYVNKAWRDEASKPFLWKEIRLKNTKIYDVYSFAEFVAARETETIDFRKMLGSVSWAELFQNLSSAPALKTLILGSKVYELGELARQFCPHLEVIEQPPM